MKVRLADDTCGEVETADIGDVVTVSLHDENGLPIEVTGEVAEILED
jgi:hypothetical protein